MSKWIVDIHGEIKGDYEIIKKYEEPRKGKWTIYLSTAIEDFYQCSECGRMIHVKQTDSIKNYPYCHCGAKMKEGR